MKAIHLLVLFLCLAGCATPGSHFTLVSNKMPDGIDMSEAVTVTGSAGTTFIALSYPVPLGANYEFNLEKAVENALQKAPGKNLLVNVQATRYFNYYFFVFTRGIEVTGQAVSYNPRAETAN